MVSILTILLLLLPITITAQDKGDSTKEQISETSKIAQDIIKTAQKYHYREVVLDSKFSEHLFKNFIERVDPYALVFSNNQYQMLKNDAPFLHEWIEEGELRFVDKVITHYNVQIRTVDSLLEAIGQNGISLDKRDTLKLSRSMNRDEALDVKWDKWVRLMVLSTHFDTDSTAEPLTQELIDSLLSETIARERCRIESRISKDGSIDSLIKHKYLASIAETLDPHSSYFTAEEEDMYHNALSSQSGTFGVVFETNRIGEIEVKEIIAGGPAWASNRINEGDVIHSITKSSGEILYLNCVSIQEIYSFLAGITYEQAVFEIKKKDRRIDHVPLRKALLDVEENVIESYVAHINNRPVGFISLPSFFGDFSYRNYMNKGCANLLAKEIIALRSDSIAGLVLDLRSNSGGLMNEALKIAGAFVNRGTLCITDSRQDGLSTKKDRNPGQLFSKPLVILVDASSASASELLAGTLQDYNRAVIVGAPTFGKSTMQFHIPADSWTVDSLHLYQKTPKGFVGLTKGAFYRITGKSHQYNGIQPDISLPFIFEARVEREQDLTGALILEPVEKKVYAFTYPALPLDSLLSLSTKRLQESQAFSFITKKAGTVDESISFPLYHKQFEEFDSLYSTWEDSLALLADTLNITYPQSSKNAMITNESEEAQELLSSIGTDPYIHEAFQVLNDLITINEGTTE